MAKTSFPDAKLTITSFCSMKRFDWIYQFSVSHYEFIVLDRPDPFIFQVEALKRVSYTRLLSIILNHPVRMVQSQTPCHFIM